MRAEEVMLIMMETGMRDRIAGMEWDEVWEWECTETINRTLSSESFTLDFFHQRNS